MVAIPGRSECIVYTFVRYRVLPIQCIPKLYHSPLIWFANMEKGGTLLSQNTNSSSEPVFISTPSALHTRTIRFYYSWRCSRIWAWKPALHVLLFYSTLLYSVRKEMLVPCTYRTRWTWLGFIMGLVRSRCYAIVCTPITLSTYLATLFCKALSEARSNIGRQTGSWQAGQQQLCYGSGA